MNKRKTIGDTYRIEGFRIYAKYSFLIILSISIIICIIDNRIGLFGKIFSDTADCRNVAENFFFAEVQIAFIVVSLTTILSQSTKNIYWVDSYSYRLISPRYTNFVALISYILTTIIVGLILIVLERFFLISCFLGVLCNFILCFGIMILLSVRMLEANFGEEKIKDELEDYLLRLAEKKNLSKTNEIRKLVQFSIQEIDDRDISRATDNLKLLLRFDCYAELRTVYDYAKANINSPNMLEGIDLALIKETVVNQKQSFLFRDKCPINEELAGELWHKIIVDIFNESEILWESGREEDALLLRANLFVVLSDYLCSFYSNRILHDLDYQDDIESELLKAWYHIISLMCFFVYTRECAFYEENEENGMGYYWKREETAWQQHEEKLVPKDIMLNYNELYQSESDSLNGRLKDMCERAYLVADNWASSEKIPFHEGTEEDLKLAWLDNIKDYYVGYWVT